MKNVPIFKRGKQEAIYGGFWFLSVYSLLFFLGGGAVAMFACPLLESHGSWICYMVVGLIILASSLLTKMLLGWLQDVQGISRHTARTRDAENEPPT